tara:strand:+ start:8563 stop:8781 length:219 start_codon:yes stop_codon:yes gene_type:complete
VEQEAADTDLKKDNDQKGDTAIFDPLLLAPGLLEKPVGRQQKRKIGDGVERFRPKTGIDALTVAVDRLAPHD